MLENSEYFDGKVKSIAFTCKGEPATIGVMAPGEYEFSTSRQEIMKVISGTLIVRLPDEAEWKPYGEGEQFVVQTKQKFAVKVEEDSSYLCIYR